METMRQRIGRPLRIGLIALTTFLGLTAAGGGIGLLGGWIAPGVELLDGSSFGSYLIPGLALLVLVGGSGLLAAALLLRRSAWGAAASGVAAAMILIFEGVEFSVIGYHWLQAAYVGIGILIALFAGLYWWAEQHAAPDRLRVEARAV